MKDKVIEYLKINIFKILIPLILLLISVFEFVYFDYKFNNNKNDSVSVDNNLSMNIEEEKEEVFIYTDIKGEVAKPSVYKMKEGSRVTDLIKEAGGLSKNANTRFINLSKKLEDGEVIVIYSNKEISDAKKNKTLEVSAPCVCEEVKNDACYNEKESDNKTNNDNIIVNINTATSSELTTLNGIGEQKAKAIISYRNTNGKFKKIEDIMNVSGISETLFSKIKKNITV